QKEKFLKPLARGEKIGAFGLTEPEAGSDSGSTMTTAQLSSGKYIINGTKCFITSAGYADTFIITAVTDVQKKSVSALIVEKGTPGFSIGKTEDKLGLKASDTSALIFENCLIPDENLLGNPGDGSKIFLKTLDGGRISIGAMALGLAQGALDVCLQYISDKKMLAPDIFTRQIAKGTLADMHSEIMAARSLVYHAARMKDSGKPFTLESASAKLFASETAMRVTSDALSFIGAEGCSKKYPAARFFKDAKVTQIGEGTSEIQRLVIARELLRNK
ncbi:MAG: acyl-CoA dehydrogenase family protein, partial [Firmicutes bacterium]|nr:acyl-CoA dehydrogenase family protein [Bacillota bacterium]